MRWSLLPVVFLMACGASDDDLCARFYEPYPNHIGQRPRTEGNSDLLDAMAAYDRGDYVTASAGLSVVIGKDADDRLARLYLASALLGAGEPYKAEMHLDFLERVPGATFKDQTEWYNTLCWLCSGQLDRARTESARIAAQPLHTYKEEAKALNQALIVR
jgi:predicted Zn-dependent protease